MHFANPHVCPTATFLKSPAKSTFKRLILETPLYQHLLLTMSSAATSKLNNADCEKGHVSQWPPISYATSKDEASIKASRETIKMKTPEARGQPGAGRIPTAYQLLRPHARKEEGL